MGRDLETLCRVGVGTCLVVAVSALCGCLPVGQRLLTFEIESEGVVVLQGIRGVPDSTPVERMWDELAGIDFRLPEGSTADIEVAGKLAGPVVVRIKHVDRELDRVVYESVNLQYQPAQGCWLFR